jgi:hypothetical protein
MGKVRVVHVQSNGQSTDIFTKALPKPLFKNYKQMPEMKERDFSLRENDESSKLQVPTPKDQKLGNTTISRYPMSNPKKQQHQELASAKGKTQDGPKPNSS